MKQAIQDRVKSHTENVVIPRKPWISQERWNLINEGKKVKQKEIKNTNDKHKYGELTEEINKLV